MHVGVGFAVVLATTGCSDGEAAGEARAAAAADETGGTGGPAEDGAEQAEEEPAAEPAGEPLELAVKESVLGNIVPSQDPPRLTAWREEDGRLGVQLENLNAPCRDVPDLEARRGDGEVRIHVAPLPEGRRRCVGPHDMKLRIESPGHDVERIRVLSASGRELASAEIASEG